MNDQPFATGGCQCGAVTLSILHKPDLMVQCHCLDCQKSSGTGHTSNAYFSNDDVDIKGEVSGYTVTSDSGTKMTRYFCPICGSRVLGRNSGNSDRTSISIGCLDNHSWFKPNLILYSSRQHNWDITSDEVPSFDAMPADD